MALSLRPVKSPLRHMPGSLEVSQSHMFLQGEKVVSSSKPSLLSTGDHIRQETYYSCQS